MGVTKTDQIPAVTIRHTVFAKISFVLDLIMYFSERVEYYIYEL